MPADYPGAVHSFISPSGKAGVALLSEHIAAHTELALELQAVESELGIGPSGYASTVRERLDAMPFPGAYGRVRAGAAVRAFAAARVDQNAYNTQSRLTCVPFYLAVTGNLFRHMYVPVGTGASGATVRFGIYNSDPATLLPQTLSREWGTVDASSPGEKIYSLAFGDEHDPGVGLFWLAAVIQGAAAATSRYVASGFYGMSINGDPTTDIVDRKSVV